MPTSLAEVEKQARSLSEVERAKLAELLLESIQEASSTITHAWQQEIENRVSAYDRGETETFAASDVFAEARHLAQ